MTPSEQARFNQLYQAQHGALLRQGMRPATIDGYCRALKRITQYFDQPPDNLTLQDLKTYFEALIISHSWSTVKIDRNGLQFFYKHVLNIPWQWLDIVKPPQHHTLPDILTPDEVTMVINQSKQLRFKVGFLVLYSMGLRISEGLTLRVCDIDAKRMLVHIHNAKGGKDRFVPIPQRTLHALRYLWTQHHHPVWLFPNPDGSDHLTRCPMQKAMKSVLKQCGIRKNISPHSLRHSYATHLLALGVDLRSLQTLLGQHSLNTTVRYTRLVDSIRDNTQLAVNQLVDNLDLYWGLS
ncbi:phage integrase [Catenovulum agarivorans DS-2]|uniref:Phage integrase n=1 Tax=Catenovulum agarivorans DS-2 TaxID=1328313 RepID=W7QGP9_9ALTE|nr:site-specific integrase [Catenovulum agarivorans]EWH08092.1 phage integrase [Catenovulum agarivorans DS-2]